MKLSQHLLPIGAVSILALCLAPACTVLSVDADHHHHPPPPAKDAKGHGPPPHAPAHGHRAKTDHGVDVVFDVGFGVYIVVDHPHHYYDDAHYYRLHEGVWQVSARVDAGWKVVEREKLPPGLRDKGKAKGKGKSDERGKGKEKGKGKGKGKGHDGSR